MIFYLLSALPILVWAIQWYYNRKVVWQEAAIGTGAALLVAVIFQVIESGGAFIPSDTETWSGQVEYAQHQPRWREYYEEAIYRTEFYTTGTGKNKTIHSRRVFDHWESRRRWHEDSWWAVTELGTFDIPQSRYDDILKNFGEMTHVNGVRRTGEHASKMIEGVSEDDQAVNKNKYVYPVTDNRKFENRLLKAKGSLYNFQAVTEEEKKGLYEWPSNRNRFDTDRLLGNANTVWSQRDWDQMNAILGPTKNVNVIAIGYPAGSSLQTGVLQERLWHGGKKNDLILAFGPDWAYVFGWTERESVKRLLENRLRSKTATIDEITKLINTEYELVKFEEKFEHIQVETPWWYYLIYGIVVILSQGAANYFFSTNNVSKGYNRC
jgi:hypothetical protein